MNETEELLSGVRVLIAEDDSLLALELNMILKKAGADVVGPARNLEQAIALAQSEFVSVAVLDVSLGKEDIFPAAEILRERGIGIVFYTGYSEIDELQNNWPEAEVIIKPAPSKVLIPAVVKAMSALQDAVG